ncbi:MAG: hypothetical protein IT355_08545 [Gemmatimonadaceae bacterium]|nr:hypothetical protein [Gemmatimonadaceae bacterium]
MLLLSAIGASAASAQAAPAQRATTGWHFAIAGRPAGAPAGVLVLMPGYGGDFDDFAVPDSRGLPLADSLAKAGIATLLVGPTSGVLFGDSAYHRQLEDTIVEAMQAAGVGDVPMAVGGFSAGGTDAILLGERCARHACTLRNAIRAVIEVDAPLDWHRLWANNMLALRNPSPRTNVTEARLVLRSIEARIGAHPTPTSPRFLAASPLASRDARGGQARHLARVAVRAYTEPDISWWLEQRGGDYYGLNALDAATLVRVLRAQGNADASLVVTSGRGYRGDGTRHPHSWSIVDQPELATWVAKRLAR